MKRRTAFFVFVFLSVFNMLDATDTEYDQLRTYLKTRFKTETYIRIGADFAVDQRTVSNFVSGKTSKSPALLNKAKTTYPNIFQQAVPVYHVAVAPLVPQIPNVLPIIDQLPIVQQPVAPALSQHLSLPDLAAGSKYVISMVPMNSSGDSYHILAYLILSLSHQKTVPAILLTYDGVAEIRDTESKMNSYTQVQRTMHFAQALGYGNYFKTAFIDTGSCQRENNRQSKLE